VVAVLRVASGAHARRFRYRSDGRPMIGVAKGAGVQAPQLPPCNRYAQAPHRHQRSRSVIGALVTQPSPIAVVELVMTAEREHWHFAERSSHDLAVDVIGALRLAGYLREEM
jgi:hypothetical protein